MFKRKRNVTKVNGFGPFLGPIYPQKTQNTVKNQNFFQKLNSYNYQITQVPGPDKSQNSSKINFKKPFFGPKMDFLMYKIGR